MIHLNNFVLLVGIISFVVIALATATSPALALAKNKGRAVVDSSSSSLRHVGLSKNFTGCWACEYSPSGTCCQQGQMCPGNVECCATEANVPVACETSCNAQCAGKECGNGGCKMLSDTTCGTCGNGQECNATSGMCVKAPQCLPCFSGECCTPNQSPPQMCPGGDSCCDCGENSCDCKHECTPKCDGATCGTGGCPGNEHNCGTCPLGDECVNNNNCQCQWSCSCGDPGSNCGTCPSYSAGCSNSGLAKCTCLGPKSSYQEVFPKSFVFQTSQMYELGCTGGISCGGFAPINASTPIPYVLSYTGEKSYAQSVGLYVIFESPTGKPLPGTHIYLNVGKNNSIDSACCQDMHIDQRLAFSVSMTNCTQEEYFYCFSDVDERCFKKEDPITEGKCKVVATNGYGNKPVLGNGAGAWFENPGTSSFTVLVFVSDYYYQCSGCGNSAEGWIYPSGISIQYILQ